jgi:hypothetical protein
MLETQVQEMTETLNSTEKELSQCMSQLNERQEKMDTDAVRDNYDCIWQ